MTPVHHGIYGTTTAANTTLNSAISLDQTNDYSTYGQVTGLLPHHSTVLQPQNSQNMSQNQAWYDSDL